MKMDSILIFLTVVGTIDSIILVGVIGYAFYLWLSGIAPVLLRLGNGLAKRKVAIFAKGDNLVALRNLLLDSKLIKAKNICEVATPQDMEASHGASLFLIYWPDWSADIDVILDRKSDSCALIVYQPYDQGRIPDDVMKKLDGKRHTAVTNFRGRLLNDIVTAIITTSHEKE